MSKRTQSQIGRASRRKGKAFECWCARYFTQWTGLKWESTRNSGRTDLKGDIYCVSRPDLLLTVECKDDKRYSVHAMLKPTKAFADMVRYIYHNRLKDGEVYLIIIVKNQTGIWLNINFNFFRPQDDADTMVTEDLGQWVRLQHLLGGVCEGVHFDAGRMETTGGGGKK